MEKWQAVLNSLMNLICGLLHKFKYFNAFQTVCHTVHTQPTPWIKTRHITLSSITPQKQDNFNTKDFYLLTIFNLHNFNQNYNNFLCSDDDTANHTVPLYYCNNNITLKMAATSAEICW
jgi:hypothetical protein